MLGHDVTAAAARAGHDVTPLARRELDVRDAAAVRAAIAAARPDAVVNCAAWTDVDGAEADEPAATAINGAGAGNVAAAAPRGRRVRRPRLDRLRVRRDRARAVRRVGGDRAGERIRPLQARGRARRRARPRPARTRSCASAWLFGRHGGNFVATMLRLAGERDALTVVDDQVGCPTFTGHLARRARRDRRAAAAAASATSPARGSCSWYDLAAAAFAATGAEVELARGRTADLGRPAPRPAYSVLRSERPDTPVLPPWQDGLHAYLELGVTA